LSKKSVDKEVDTVGNMWCKKLGIRGVW